MKNLIAERRRSGVLAHISSLPSPYGIGDIGTAGYRFLQFLEESGQSCWQFLPLNPTNSLFDNSPYMSSSAFAGSPLLISPDLLYKDGLIDGIELNAHKDFSPYTTEYAAVSQYKSYLLRKAFQRFTQKPDSDYEEFLKKHSWLDDYALFMALKDYHRNAGWFQWDKELALRDEKALAIFRGKLREEIEYYRFEQYVFYKQWHQLHAKATELNILLFGDIPIYVGLDSVDVWAHQQIFSLDEHTGLPSTVSGVPPDYFSETGQRWGNPLYRWDSEDKTIQNLLIDWWVERFTAVFELVDIARIDHFRAFDSYWAIPADSETAMNGKWMQGPGKSFFTRIEERLGTLDIVAEDLGIITDEVIQLRDELGFPGMKVLQFAFDGNRSNSFLPYNFDTPNCVVYTGTHDNDTTVGWFLDNKIGDELRTMIKRVANRSLHDASGIHHDMIYLAMSSISNLAILPLQDILGFGNDCKMNSPGVAERNWRWRCSPEFLTADVVQYLFSVTELFGRCRQTNS